MIGGVPWRPWDAPPIVRSYGWSSDPDEIGGTIAERMPTHPGVRQLRWRMHQARLKIKRVEEKKRMQDELLKYMRGECG
jgi:hypothetical protein